MVSSASTTTKLDTLVSTLLPVHNYSFFQISKEQVENLADHCNIDNFKKNNAIFNQNVRKGQVGDWVNYFKDESKLNEFEQWIIKNNKFEIPFKYY